LVTAATTPIGAYHQAAGRKFEVIFVSGDKDQASFDGYMAEMPWLAIPWSNEDVKAKLGMNFKVQGIPNLIVLDKVSGWLAGWWAGWLVGWWACGLMG
jgi:hypothetical protein